MDTGFIPLVRASAYQVPSMHVPTSGTILGTDYAISLCCGEQQFEVVPWLLQGTAHCQWPYNRHVYPRTKCMFFSLLGSHGCLLFIYFCHCMLSNMCIHNGFNSWDHNNHLDCSQLPLQILHFGCMPLISSPHLCNMMMLCPLDLKFKPLNLLMHTFYHCPIIQYDIRDVHIHSH